jgi:RNA polymerase sigma factor for flagellar operon FliA
MAGVRARAKKGPRRRRKRQFDVAPYLPLVTKIAGRMARSLPANLDVRDLVSSGVLGLMEAAQNYDPSHPRGLSFESFADFRIRGAIKDDLRLADSLSRDFRRMANEIRDATHVLEGQLIRPPEHGEIAQALGIPAAELHRRQGKLTGSKVVGIDDAGPNLLERFADPMADNPFEITARHETVALLLARIRELPEGWRRVLSLRYNEDLLFHEIGEVMGYTESRACQIHGDAIKRLRAELDAMGAA